MDDKERTICGELYLAGYRKAEKLAGSFYAPNLTKDAYLMTQRVSKMIKDSSVSVLFFQSIVLRIIMHLDELNKSKYAREIRLQNGKDDNFWDIKEIKPIIIQNIQYMNDLEGMVSREVLDGLDIRQIAINHGVSVFYVNLLISNALKTKQGVYYNEGQ